MPSKSQPCISLLSTTRLATLALATAIVLLLTVVLAHPAQAQTYQVLYNFTGGQDGAYPGSWIDHGWRGKSLRHGLSRWKLEPRHRVQTGAPRHGMVVESALQLHRTDRRRRSHRRSRVWPQWHALRDYRIRRTTLRGGMRRGLQPETACAICKTIICPWTETVIYSFRGDTDGANPGYGNLTFDHAGNIYGTTYFGGNNAEGVVYKLTLSNGSWTESAIHIFSGSKRWRKLHTAASSSMPPAISTARLLPVAPTAMAPFSS